MELLQAAFSASNLFLTVLFMFILLYWLVVIIGAFKIDALDFDMHTDVHIDAHGHDVHTDVPHGGSGSIFLGMLRFFNFGKVPFMIVMSILILSMWSISILCNHEGSWLNPYNSFWISLLYFIPNLFVSSFIMKFLSTPLVPIFEKLDNHKTELHYEGYSGTITTEIGEEGVGQVKLFIDNSSIVIAAKTKDGQPLQKGQKVVILQKSEDEKCYIVERSDEVVE